MESKIIDYLQKNKVLTIATSVNNQPYCANCFYVFDEMDKTLIFLSDNKTRHIKEAIQNNEIGGSVQNGVTTVTKIQGIQFTGKFISPTEEQAKGYYKTYYQKFPFAKAKPSLIWAIQLNWVKMTDNTLGFGKKLIWEK
ncbi:MAG: hypothetical protein COA97_01705 [Flavobacteriales bacterium]|nr:MAG: hypothetical protein COA97_01705 [Flavobacteriales bacterium]